jgi:CDP-diacylglycerol--serine O-phosphatidyltransferase
MLNKEGMMKQLPNLVTFLNILLGVFAIILCAGYGGQGPHVRMACWLIVICTILDTLDGKLARMVGSASSFGIELDSLADVISFGVAPAVIFYSRYLTEYAITMPVLLAVPFLTVLCGAFRLARFNISATTKAKKGFSGLPITAGGGTLAAFILFFYYLEEPSFLGYSLPLPFGAPRELPMLIIACGAALLMAFLMASTIPYPTTSAYFFNKPRLPGKLFIVLTLLLLFLVPSVGWFFMGGLYTLRGMVTGTWEVIRQKPAPAVLGATKH